MGGEAEERATMTSKLAIVLAAKSKSLVYTSPATASPDMFASPIHTLASVPFCWEEEPGKPKHHLLPPHSYKCLELPPRLLLPSNEFTKMPLPAAGRKGLLPLGFFWKKKAKADVGGRGSYVFPSCVDNHHSESYRGEDSGDINSNMKITRIHKQTSLSPRSSHSHFWANMYNGFKQVVQRKSKKLRREGF